MTDNWLAELRPRRFSNAPSVDFIAVDVYSSTLPAAPPILPVPAVLRGARVSASGPCLCLPPALAPDTSGGGPITAAVETPLRRPRHGGGVTAAASRLGVTARRHGGGGGGCVPRRRVVPARRAARPSRSVPARPGASRSGRGCCRGVSEAPSSRRQPGSVPRPAADNGAAAVGMS